MIKSKQLSIVTCALISLGLGLFYYKSKDKPKKKEDEFVLKE